MNALAARVDALLARRPPPPVMPRIEGHQPVHLHQHGVTVIP